MSSCLNDSAVSSPTIRFYSQMYRTSPEGVKDTLYLVDTVQIGDTLRLPVLLQGGFNILTSFQVSSDPLDHMVKLEVDSAVATIVDPKSDLEKGKLVFPQDRQILMCNVTVCFIPQRAGSQPINLTVANTAGDKYSHSYCSERRGVKITFPFSSLHPIVCPSLRGTYLVARGLVRALFAPHS